MSLYVPPPGSSAAAERLLYPPAVPFADDPVGFARDVLRFEAWSKQREILEAIRDQPRTAVRACHGPGKTATAAQGALWFLKTKPNSRVITTAPTWAQVEQLLWREIRGAAHRSPAGTFPVPNATKLELGDEWFAIGLSTDKPERFQGHHADHILLIVDEASGVDEAIYEAAEGFLTAQGAHMLLLGNPTRLGGQFHRAFTAERGSWRTIHISVFDTPNYTGEPVSAQVARSLPRKEWAAEKLAQWGEHSPMYQVRVLGNFPSEAENTVIGLLLIEQAQARDLPADSAKDLVVISCDVARYGSDETVICERIAQQVRIAEHYVGKRPPDATATGGHHGDLVATAGRIVEHARRHPRGAVRVVVDDTGVGGGVTDILRNEGWPVTAFNGGEQAHRPLEFPNRRSELWFEGAAQMPDLDLDSDDQLAADLSAPTYAYDLKQRRVVEKKADTKRRLGRSPDRGDAALLTLVPEQSPMVVVPAGRRPRDAFGGQELSDDEWLTRTL